MHNNDDDDEPTVNRAGRRARRATRMFFSIGALSLTAAACVGGGSVSVDDATITDCANDGSQRVRVEVENVGSEIGNFMVDVVRYNAETGQRRDAVSVPVEVVPPGETASGYAFGETYFGPGYTCEIVDLQSFGSN